MKGKQLLMMLIFLIVAFKTLASEDDYTMRWCRDVGNTLETALRNSTYTMTYDEEQRLLLQAIKMSIQKTPEKNNEYFVSTLKEISIGLVNYSLTKEKVYYLRAQTRYALSDLHYLDHRFECPLCEGNNAEYVEEVLSRGLEEGMSTKTDKQEEFALNHAANFSLGLLNDSTFSRTYTCSKRALQDALEISNLNVKRDLMRKAISDLDDRLFCRQ